MCNEPNGGRAAAVGWIAVHPSSGAADEPASVAQIADERRSSQCADQSEGRELEVEEANTPPPAEIAAGAS